MIAIILISFSLFLLLIASYFDIKYREVADWVWLIMIIGGIILHLIQIFTFILNEEPFFNYLINWSGNLIVAIIIALILLLGGLWGGADMFALIAIAVCSPMTGPVFILGDNRVEILIKIVPRSFSLLSNAILLTVPVPFILFFYNCFHLLIQSDLYKFQQESLKSKIAVLFIGYPRNTVKISAEMETKPWHFDFLEEYDQDTGWRIKFRLGLDNPENDYKRKKFIITSIKNTKKQTIWVQPSYPFILILTLGFITEILIGNILFITLSYLIP